MRSNGCSNFRVTGYTRRVPHPPGLEFLNGRRYEEQSDASTASLSLHMTRAFPLVSQSPAVFVVLIGLFIGSNNLVAYGSDSSDLPIRELRLFSEVFNRIKTEYVKDIDDSQLLRDAVKGMLNGLDPHSAYLDPQTYREVNIDTRGEFGGLGIEITIEDDAIRVVAPIDGTPAKEAGVLPGDRIIRLDGFLIQGMDLDEAVNLMRGEPGTEIQLLI